MRRVLGFMMVVGLLFGAAACGSSGGSDAKSDKSATSDDAGNSGSDGSSTESSNPDVQAYCDAVDDFVEKISAAGTDADKIAALSDENNELTEKAQALAVENLSGEELREVADCTAKAAQAYVPSN